MLPAGSTRLFERRWRRFHGERRISGVSGEDPRRRSVIDSSSTRLLREARGNRDKREQRSDSPRDRCAFARLVRLGPVNSRSSSGDFPLRRSVVSPQSRMKRVVLSFTRTLSLAAERWRPGAFAVPCGRAISGEGAIRSRSVLVDAHRPASRETGRFRIRFRRDGGTLGANRALCARRIDNGAPLTREQCPF